MTLRKPLSILIAVSVISGCTSNQIKQNMDTAVSTTTTFVKENRAVIGTVVGATIGYVVSGKNDKGLGLLAGALVGGLFADQLGKYLDEKDRAALESHTLAQMNNKRNNTTQWRSKDSGASVKVKTSNSKTTTKDVEVVKLKQVQMVDDLDLIGKTYVAKTKLNVRYSPKVSSNNIVGSLVKNAQFTAVGRTKNNWILVAQDGVSVGYVSGRPQYVGPTGSQVSMMRDGGIDLDAIDDTQIVAGVNLDGIDLDSVEVDKADVVAKTECRTVEYDITSAKGEKGNTSYEACRGADGAWELG